MKNSRTKRRPYLTAAVIVAVAVVGLLLISSDGGYADQSAATALSKGEAAQQNATDQLFAGSALPALLKMVGALLVVIVCIYAGIYLLKRTMGARFNRGHGANALEIIETTAVGQRKSISLIRVGEKSVLVGVTEDRMALLSELDAADTAAILADVPPQVATESFGAMLNNAATRMKKIALKNRRAALES